MLIVQKPLTLQTQPDFVTLCKKYLRSIQYNRLFSTKFGKAMAAIYWYACFFFCFFFFPQITNFPFSESFLAFCVRKVFFILFYNPLINLYGAFYRR